MKLFCIPGVLILMHFTAAAQSRPCTDSMHRQFDFWIGEWEAFGPKGKKAGDSKVSLILDSCIILEEWAGTTVVKGLSYAGKSYNTYNVAKQRWQQYWVDNAGGVTEYFNGYYTAGKMILETTDEKQPGGGTRIQRMTFYNLAPDKVRQLGESSADGGKTWTTDFDLEYRRKK